MLLKRLEQCKQGHRTQQNTTTFYMFAKHQNVLMKQKQMLFSDWLEDQMNISDFKGGVDSISPQ